MKQKEKKINYQDESVIKSIESSLNKKTNKNTPYYRKYENEQCNNKMTFEECELAILRHAVDENEKIVGEKTANTEDIKNIIGILENFLTKSKCICYGGSAINALLPVNAQFYNKNIEIPDYDFYTPNAINVAKELADIYYKEGYEEVEAKAGVHFGTYKVFVNFIPIADITFINPHIYEKLSKDCISVAGIKYAPVNFLRMSLYLELSRPAGDISRWEKVFKRLVLLNKYHPLKLLKVCKTVDFHTNLREIELPSPKTKSIDLDFVETGSFGKNHFKDNLYYHVRDSLIEQGAVFIGGYATSLYKTYLPKHLKDKPSLLSVPDFDVIIEDSSKCSLILRERLQELGFKNITEKFVPSIDDIIPSCYEIRVNNKQIANIFTTIACHNFNKINVGTNIVNVATIDTIMSFYLAFYFSDRFIHFRERILCMAKFLFDLEKHNHLNQHGLLKRFSMTCIGKQKTIENIRSEKTEKYKYLKLNNNFKEYEKWFLNYRPSDKNDFDEKNLINLPKKQKTSVLTKLRSEDIDLINTQEKNVENNQNTITKESINNPNVSFTTNNIKSILKPSSLLKKKNKEDNIKILYDKLDDLPKQKNKTKKLRFKTPIVYNEKENIFKKPRRKSQKRRNSQKKKYISDWMNRRK